MTPIALALAAQLAAAAAGSPAPEGTPMSRVFSAAGVRDAATAATVVHCANLGAATTEVRVEFYDFDGSFLCALGGEVFFGETWTWATRETARYREDSKCTDDGAPAPLAEQGSVDILVTVPTKLVCTVQIVDPANAKPVYADRLTLFDGDGVPLSARIFLDDFESGNTVYWSASSG